MTRKNSSTSSDVAGEGVSEEVSQFATEYPTLGDTDIDDGSLTATREIEYGDGSDIEVTSPVTIEAEDATIATDANGSDGIVTEDGRTVTEADMAAVGAAPSGIDADGRVGGYDDRASQAVLRPFDAAPYVSSADEQRDIRMHAELAERSSRSERERVAAEDFAAASRS